MRGAVRSRRVPRTTTCAPVVHLSRKNAREHGGTARGLSLPYSVPLDNIEFDTFDSTDYLFDFPHIQCDPLAAWCRLGFLST